jgi:hypothetical protein
VLSYVLNLIVDDVRGLKHTSISSLVEVVVVHFDCLGVLTTTTTRTGMLLAICNIICLVILFLFEARCRCPQYINMTPHVRYHFPTTIALIYANCSKSRHPAALSTKNKKEVQVDK